MLKTLLLRHGLAKVSVMLGYRSQSTISHWLRNNKIPSLAIDKVKELYVTTNKR